MSIKRMLVLLLALPAIIIMESKSIEAASAKVGVRLTIVDPSAIDVEVRELSSLKRHEGSKDVILDIVSKNINENLKVDNFIYLEHKWDKNKNIGLSRVGKGKVDETIQSYKLDTPIETALNEYKGELTIVTNYN